MNSSVESNLIRTKHHGSFYENISLDECAKCGGDCCKQGYDPTKVGFNNDMEKYRKMKPSNPELAYYKDKISECINEGKGYKKVMKEAKSKGINVYQCRFLGDNGCIIPREERPVICRSFICLHLKSIKENSNREE